MSQHVHTCIIRLVAARTYLYHTVGRSTYVHVSYGWSQHVRTCTIRLVAARTYLYHTVGRSTYVPVPYGWSHALRKKQLVSSDPDNDGECDQTRRVSRSHHVVSSTLGRVRLAVQRAAAADDEVCVEDDGVPAAGRPVPGRRREDTAATTSLISTGVVPLSPAGCMEQSHVIVSVKITCVNTYPERTLYLWRVFLVRYTWNIIGQIL